MKDKANKKVKKKKLYWFIGFLLKTVMIKCKIYPYLLEPLFPYVKRDLDSTFSETNSPRRDLHSKQRHNWLKDEKLV
jgi:hypothetical protein